MPEETAQAGGGMSAEKIQHGTALFLRTNLALFCAGFATFSLLYCVQPLLPVLSAEFHVGAPEASLALSLTTGLLSVSILVAGMVSDIWGRKAIMVASLLSSAVLTMICAVVPHWPTLLVMRALTGVTLAGLPAVAMAYVGEEMHPRSLGLAMGLYVGGTSLGGMSGRLLTGVVTDLWDWRTAVMTIGLIGLLSALILWRSLPPSRHFVRREPRPGVLLRVFAVQFSDPVLPLLFLEAFVLMGGFVTIYNYIGYRLVAAPFLLSQTEIGLIFTVYVCGTVSSAWIGGLAGRYGRRNVFPVPVVLMLTGVALTLSGTLWVIVAGIAVMTFGFFGAHSVASGWVGLQAKSGKAQASSLYLFAYYLGSSVVGSLGGFFWKHGGWPGVAGMTGTLILIALALGARLRALTGRAKS